MRRDICGNPTENQRYFDYTASAKPDQYTVDTLGQLLKQSPQMLREKAREAADYVTRQLGGKKADVLVPNGAGATGPFNLLVDRIKEKLLRENPKAFDDLAKKPVVFISKREHHSNILPWLEAGFEICQIGLTDQGLDDYRELKARLGTAFYDKQPAFISWSASSNVTSVKADLDRLNRAAKKYNTPVFLDLAAHVSHHPYNFSAHSQVKGVVVAGHKNHGGPGSCGALLVKADYQAQILKDEDRDLVQTGVGELPLIHLALTFKLMQDIGIKKIDKIEMEHAKRIFKALNKLSNVKIIGPKKLDHRGSIISFNICVENPDEEKTITIDKRHYIKPGILGDAIETQFNIIGRAGCSCAGPYGKELLGMTEESAQEIQDQIKGGNSANKPGWFRMRADFLKTSEDVDLFIDAVTTISSQYQ